MAKIKTIIIISLLLLVYWFPRLYQFPQKMTFHLDQGIQLLDVYHMVQTKKPLLIGPSSSKNYDGRSFYFGVNYYYLLAAAGVITNWDPVNITLFFTVIEFAVFVFFVLWVRRRYGNFSALTIYLFIAVSQFFIIHSRFFWNPNLLFPAGLLLVIFLASYIQKPRPFIMFIIAFILGNAFSFHHVALFWFLPLIFIMFITKTLFQLKYLFIILFGFIAGDILYLVFELRHHFYNFNTIIFILQHRAAINSNIEPHYIIYPIVPFALWLLAIFFNHYHKNRLILSGLIILCFAATLCSYFLFNQSLPYGHPPGWTYPLMQKTINIILKDGCPLDFNIASTVSGDTRSYDQRYLLTINKCPPMDVDKYPFAQTLFLIAPNHRPPVSETVWEVSSLRPFKVVSQTILSDRFTLYQIVKN